jgi:hypothetical protein
MRNALELAAPSRLVSSFTSASSANANDCENPGSSRHPLQSARAVSLGADALAMIIGLEVSASVRLIGTIPGAEIALISLLPILLIVRSRKITRGKLKYPERERAS